ncbi:hypothetical protein CHGG_06993 [Chaetomium globosum CBS 148.51]|jgi:hypothetical protein|uniref:Protein ecm33 n=1 Tax=Chaetomium globosum (strain ATCC 6205 / CBS 148.51 / DSM 1962 / NBRC 6347 / NRRL 1970) TaxID=306901 RepID=Q2GYG1_CHAGB|nr:uncharacterized protein CHGG_06993 [Chaetomium globosum CBS 148.51]EAQ85740.1 hypothetical protein CHGG_06993 [Chaetomium globosum CBS 148.51]
MFVKQLLPALVAIGSAAAQSATCTVSTTTINGQAEATKLAGCGTVKGTVVLGSQGGATVELSGPKEITGNLIVENNGMLETFSSPSLQKIGGTFRLQNVTFLTSLQFPKLTEAQSIEWGSVTRLDSVTLGPLDKADNVRVSDTFLDNLDAFSLTTVKKLTLDNNRRLSKYTSQLTSLSDRLVIQANGLELEVDLSSLKWINDMEIANVTKFSVPALQVVNGSALFDSNRFPTFSAPNLTHTEKGDISFVGNGFLKNMTFPKLTDIAGGLLIANNTGLDEVTFFPKLRKVSGAVKLRGNFTTVDFPSLDNVKGAFDVSSTANIRKSCDKLGEKAPRSQGGDGSIEGVFTCTADNENANEDTDGSTSNSGNVDGTDGSDENGASGPVFNAALFGLVAVAGLASAL